MYILLRSKHILRQAKAYISTLIFFFISGVEANVSVAVARPLSRLNSRLAVG